ncbi:type IV secretion system protein VirB10 [Phyllobacterium myrsinacearum]|uniref:Type IV secretion system protein VirB10 n=1 Tax=Phyllobacterium myrsinacearum TaxID=28101 RepID=A0A839EG79_9HYPH|nr:type IV secretion system protein VirB10 [Phyllobacterium myrsinacearum]MBA8877388.1 type IV secretion system protein VirB10 [Phyllobacterium myrsinacearum]
MPNLEYHRGLDSEEQTDSRLLEPKRKLGAGVVGLLFAASAIGLLALPLLKRSPSSQSEQSVSDDAFVPVHSNQLNLTPPPERLEAPLLLQAGSPVVEVTASNNNEESESRRRRAEEDARRRMDAEEAANDARQQDRYRSPMIVSELAASTESDHSEKGVDEKPKSPDTFQATNPNDQFLAALSGRSVETAKAEKNMRIDALVPQGTILRGVLETAVQTDLPGMVRAITTDEVWSFDGRRILVPSGTRLIGEYNAGLAQGQTRAFIVWTRLLRSDGVSISLGSIGTDELGRSGMNGNVNTHAFERYGSAILLSAISAGGQILAAADTSPNLNAGPVTTTYVDPKTNEVRSVTTRPNVDLSANLAAKGAAVATQTFAQVAGEALKGSLNIAPTITINQGTPIAIFVRRDLDFSDLYPDPVREKLRELKRGRTGYGQ